MDPDLPFVDIAWWMNRELIAHGSDIATVRDLYAAQPMTHRIVLREAVIDVPSSALAATRDFWSAALLARPHVLDAPYRVHRPADAAALPDIGVQDIGDGAARVHLDIETDDVEAEVARLVGLGAVEVARPHSWVVLRDPAGLLFCVVPADSPDFGRVRRPVPSCRVSGQLSGGSNFDVRSMPAARPFAEMTSAILRDASSIISSPSIAEPFLPPASDVDHS